MDVRSEVTILSAGADTAAIEEAVDLFAGETASVETASSAGSAQETLETERPDCLICGQSLPDGLGLVETARESYPTLPILFVSRDRSIAADAVTAGATDTFIRHAEKREPQRLARRLQTVLGTDNRSPAAATGTRSEDALAEQLLDTIDDVFYLLDTEGQLRRWNDEFERLSGYSKSEIAGAHALDFFGETDQGRIQTAIERVHETGSVTVEAAFLTRDGEEVPFEWTGTLWTDSDGQPRGIVGIGRDITERIERERELELKNRAMDEAPVGITITDPSREDNPLIYVNDQFTELTGYPAAEIEGENCRFLQGPATDPEAVTRMREGINAAEPVSVELRNYRKDGSEFWNRISIAPIKNNDGDVTHYIGFQENVTTRKRQERELKLKDRAMEEAPVGITIHDATASKTPLTYANDAFEELTGYDAATSETMALLSGAETDSERFDALETALANGEHFSQVILLYRNDGTPFWGRVSLAPVTDGDGETSHIVGFVQDVTKTKEHKEEIQRRLNEFGELLAEDLRHPLEDVRAGLETVDADEELSSAQQALSRMESMIDDLATVHSSTVKSRNVFDSPPTATEDR